MPTLLKWFIYTIVAGGGALLILFWGSFASFPVPPQPLLTPGLALWCLSMAGTAVSLLPARAPESHDAHSR